MSKLLFGGEGATSFDVEVRVYSIEVIFRSAYEFTDRCFVYLTEPRDGVIRVHLAVRTPSDQPRELVGAFLNALVDFRLRERIERETRTIRDLLVAQAFAEGDLLDRSDCEAEPNDDPRGISRWG